MNIIDGYQQLISDMDNMMVLMNSRSQFLASNESTAKLYGFETVGKLLGKNARQINCPAVNSSDAFLEQDRYVLNKSKQLTILDIHSYADNQPKILLTKKTPISLGPDQRGILCYCMEVQSHEISRVISILMKSDELYSGKKNNDQSFTINDTLRHNILSKRERECVFYLIRGHSMKEIGRMLNISWRTVETYIRNIKLKWGCERINQIIECAIINGFLNYLPKSFLHLNLSMIL